MSPAPGHSDTARQALVAAVEALGAGDRTPLFALLADDVRWSWMGVRSWSRTFAGKAEVVGELFGGVDETLAGQQGVKLLAVTAEEARVVVEFTGFNTTAEGHRYDNRYCWVATFENDRVTELREYMDTQLVTETFGSDPSAD